MVSKGGVGDHPARQDLTASKLCRFPSSRVLVEVAVMMPVFDNCNDPVGGICARTPLQGLPGA
jgi:hypothetical protein